MGGTGVSARAFRLLAVLALLLGLLAMHGLVHGHAAAAAAGHAAEAVHHAAPTTAVVDDGACQDGCAAPAALCVVVLTGAVLGLLLARLRDRLRGLPRAGRLTPHLAQTPPRPDLPPPDPVRELCVSRT